MDLDRAVAELERESAPTELAPGREVRLVDEAVVLRVASDYGVPKRRLELAALEAGVAPRRYHRNLGLLGLHGQARLLEAKVGVAGLGGLGGLLTETLARAGVGRLVLTDPDSFADNNLNRQAFSTEDNLGRPKVEEAAARLARINSAVEVEVHQVEGDRDEFERLFAGAAVVCDALDNLPARFALLDAARRLRVPFVHGAIAGMTGQVTTVFPEDPGLEVLYGPPREAPSRGVETVLGNPSPTPPMIAALEAQEVVKIVTGVGQPLRRKLLIIDAFTPYAAVIDL